MSFDVKFKKERRTLLITRAGSSAWESAGLLIPRRPMKPYVYTFKRYGKIVNIIDYKAKEFNLQFRKIFKPLVIKKKHEENKYKRFGFAIADAIKKKYNKTVWFYTTSIDTIIALIYNFRWLEIRFEGFRKTTNKIVAGYFIKIYDSEVAGLLKNLDNFDPSNLADTVLLYLISGIFEGDGSIRVKNNYFHITISYKKDSLKGLIVDSILKELSKRGIVSLGSYNNYERTIRHKGTKKEFFLFLANNVYHPKKRKLLIKFVKKLLGRRGGRDPEVPGSNPGRPGFSFIS